jgi:hypothetical protein
MHTKRNLRQSNQKKRSWPLLTICSANCHQGYQCSMWAVVEAEIRSIYPKRDLQRMLVIYHQ